MVVPKGYQKATMKFYLSTSLTNQSSHNSYHKSTITTLVTIYFGRITKSLPKLYQSFTIGAKGQYGRTPGWHFQYDRTDYGADFSTIVLNSAIL